MGKIILRKYSYQQKKCLYPTPLEGILDFKVNGRIILTQGNFLTANSYESFKKSPKVAQDYLAITYCPMYIYEWDWNASSLGKIEDYEFMNIYGTRNSSSRIWPAFGHHGGGCEIIMTKGELMCNKKIVLEGCRSDDIFRFDSARSDVLYISHLVITVIFEWFKKFELFAEAGQKEKRWVCKIVYSSGIVFSWYEKVSEKRYSISCGCMEDGEIVKQLKFWGYVWDDTNDTRLLAGPETKILPVTGLGTRDRKEIRYALEKDIENVLSEIYNKITVLAKYFDKISVPIQLPQPENIECEHKPSWD
ncbi:MAG: hypothetical protein QMD44_05855 [Thermodesulfovibrionales bacterium]|jgi:hypothetical protein|nr:hypothetical protein [Thermodesulfovibrionales bacterium]